MSEDVDIDKDAKAAAPEGDSQVTRRRFLIGTGTTACGVVAVGAGVLFVDFLRPRVLLEPPTHFSLVAPGTMEVGQVITSEKYRAYIMRLLNGFRAMSSVCTHLGCITRYEPDAKQIACPCHGSRFNLEGDVLAGPAPRPLDLLDMGLSSNGLITVDTATHVPHGTTFKL